MSTPVYNQAPTVGFRPFGRLDAGGRVIPTTFSNMAYQGDLNGGANLVYIGFARPGSATSAAVWQIYKIAYSGSQPVSITWPQDANSHASNDYEFIWDNRAALTYS